MSKDNYLIGKREGMPIEPLFVFSIGKQRNSERYCVYVHKNSNIKSIKDLRGRSIAILFPKIPDEGELWTEKPVSYSGLFEFIFLSKVLKNKQFNLYIY